MVSPQLLRTTEYNSVSVAELRREQRYAIAHAAEQWASANEIRGEILGFGGIDGTQLWTTQHVGVISAGGVCLEIYPKLDNSLVRNNAVDTRSATTVMGQLVWMMNAAGSLDLLETGITSQKEKPTTYIDVLAWLLGINLSKELVLGLCHHYIPRAEDLRAVRGSIDFTRQLTRNWDRMDRIACRWDEFSPDTALNRVLKAACRFLKPLTTHAAAERILTECLSMLEDVSDVRPSDALASARSIAWPRSAERFKPVFEFARKVLRGISSDTFAGASDTFAWLIDMNQLFEEFVVAAVKERFGVWVDTQKVIGTLFQVPSGGIEQKPDLLWSDRAGNRWVGDAKYKRIDGNRPWRECLDPNDVRQLTTYGGIIERSNLGAASPHLAIFYPMVGEGMALKEATTWNGLRFHLCPVRLDLEQAAGECVMLKGAPFSITSIG